MDLHQEVRADRHIKGFGHVRRFNPRRDPTNACHIGLHNAAGPLLEIRSKLHWVVHGLTNRNGYAGLRAQLHMTLHIFGGKGLFNPSQIKAIKRRGTSQRLVSSKALVGVCHDVKARAYSLTNGLQSCHIFAHVWPANFYLCTSEAIGLRSQGLLHQL